MLDIKVFNGHAEYSIWYTHNRGSRKGGKGGEKRLLHLVRIDVKVREIKIKRMW